jgi:hypothetical protein
MKLPRDPTKDASQAKARRKPVKTDHDEAEVGPSAKRPAMEVASRLPQSLVGRFRIYGLSCSVFYIGATL